MSVMVETYHVVGSDDNDILCSMPNIESAIECGESIVSEFLSEGVDDVRVYIRKIIFDIPEEAFMNFNAVSEENIAVITRDYLDKKLSGSSDRSE